jgi:hypothetical protein
LLFSIFPGLARLYPFLLAFIYVALSWLLNKILLGDPQFESIIYPFWPCSSILFSWPSLCRTFLATKQGIPRWSPLWIHPLSFLALLFSILFSWSFLCRNFLATKQDKPRWIPSLSSFLVGHACPFSNSDSLFLD